MIKATLITILIYWILKIIARLQYKNLSGLGKTRYHMRDYTIGEKALLLIENIACIAACIMTSATAFYMIFKCL